MNVDLPFPAIQYTILSSDYFKQTACITNKKNTFSLSVFMLISLRFKRILLGAVHTQNEKYGLLAKGKGLAK